MCCDWQSSRTEFWYQRCSKVEADRDQIKKQYASDVDKDGE